MDKKYKIGVGVGLLSGVFWGLNNCLFSLGYSSVEDMLQSDYLPVLCAAINDGCAALFLLSVLGLHGGFSKLKASIKGPASKYIVLAALLGGPLGQFFYYYGIVYAGASYALALTALYPIFGCILAKIFLRQNISVFMWGGICLSITGMILVGYHDAEVMSPDFSWGVLMALLAAVCWGGEIVLAVYGMQNIAADIAITIRECISGSVFLVMSIVLLQDMWAGESLLKSQTGLLILGGAGIAAAISYFCYYYANNTVGCARGTAANSTYVLWGGMFNSWLGISMLEASKDYWGCLFIIVGVLLVVMPMNSQECD